MSPRRLRVLSLMAKQEKQHIGQAAARLKELRDRELQQFDLADRLAQMIEQTAPAAAGPVTIGQLASSSWMGKQLVQQLEQTRSQMDLTRQQRQDVEEDLSRRHHREKVLSERAEETRRALIQDRANRQFETPARRPAG